MINMFAASFKHYNWVDIEFLHKEFSIYKAAIEDFVDFVNLYH